MILKMSPGIIAANLLVMAIVAVTFLNMNSIQARYPGIGMVTDDRTPAFEWAGQSQAYELLIDEDPAFGSPLSYQVTGNTFTVPEELTFGTYWWKVRGGPIESQPRPFTLVSTVALSRQRQDSVVNTGNTGLLVHRGGLAGAVSLAVNGSLEIGDDESVKAEQE